MRIEGSIQTSIERLSSMRRIQGASDDAAGLAISEKLVSQIKGNDKATDNMLSMNDLAKTAEGSLSSIQDGLHRMRELAVQASNGTLADDDRQSIQMEIDQIKTSIQDTAKNTQFNTQKVLDGTFSDKTVASDPDGRGMKMSIQNTSLETLGIQDFDVTGNFDIAAIDQAIEKVSSSRGDLGALSNRLEHGVNANRIASYNQAAANSRIADLDPALEMMNLSTQQILKQYQMYAQKQTAASKGAALNLML